MGVQCDLDYRVFLMYEPCRHLQVSSLEQYGAVDEVNIHEPCEDGEVSEEENAELSELERLLTRVQYMSVEEMAGVVTRL